MSSIYLNNAYIIFYKFKFNNTSWFSLDQIIEYQGIDEVDPKEAVNQVKWHPQLQLQEMAYQYNNLRHLQIFMVHLINITR